MKYLFWTLLSILIAAVAISFYCASKETIKINLVPVGNTTGGQIDPKF